MRTSTLSLLAIPISTLLSLAGAACKKNDASTATGEAGAAAAPATGASALGSDFEGDLTMHTTSAHGGAEDITFVIKGGKIRIDPPVKSGEAAHVIFDSSTKKMLVILDEKKMYMEMNEPSAPAGGHASQPEPQITKTGKHETIAGTDCEDWTVKEHDGKRADMCVASGIAFFDFASMGPGAAAPKGWITELQSQKYFPLKATEFDAAGKETSSMEVTKIEKKSVDDATFAPPAGYRPMNLPGAMGGMGGMPGMPGAPGAPHGPAHH